MSPLEPFQHDFMLTAFGVSAFVGALCAAFSCFLVLKGWSLMGDALSHAVLPGIVLAYVAGLPLVVGAFASGALCAVGTGFIRSHSRLREDTILGVTFTGLFALGLVLFTWVESDQHLNHVLFGNLLGLPSEVLLQTLVIGLAAGATLALKRKDLLLYCFDAAHARAIGLPVTGLHYLLLMLLAASIVAGLQAVGVLLIVAMLVTPGAIGFLMSRRFGGMLAIAVSAAVTASSLGVYFSFFLNASPAACIVLVQAGWFLLAFVFAPEKGWLAQRRLVRKLGAAS